MNKKFLQMKMDKEFEAFYKTNLLKVVCHIYYRMADNGAAIAAKNIAEDVAQDVFYLALEKWDEVKESKQPLRWLFSAANYKLMEATRKHVSHPIDYLEDNPQESLVEEPGYGMSELEESALTAVDKSEWELVKKYYFQGYPIVELAEIEGITPNNMRVRLSRMRNKLRKALGD